MSECSFPIFILFREMDATIAVLTGSDRRFEANDGGRLGFGSCISTVVVVHVREDYPLIRWPIFGVANFELCACFCGG